MKIYITNISLDDTFLNNLGISIPPDSTIDISEYADISKIFDCDELKSNILDNKLRILDNGVILSMDNSIDYLTFQTKYYNTNNDAPIDSEIYVRKNGQQNKLLNEMDIQGNYILSGYLRKNYISSSYQQNNINRYSIDFNNTEYYEYNDESGKMKILKNGRYFFSYNFLIYNLTNERNMCQIQLLRNNEIVNGTLLTCYLENINYNIRNLRRNNEFEYSSNVIKDDIPINCNENDEFYIQIRSLKSCKIDSRGTKFIINKIG